ncbi:type II toxin-antitoxin system RelB/DinJ family antitoxin [Chimaeribacter arupi]|uniref:type II toxin-antitoxin system RelB/DinJ family antitoxin n=1 Tax=Chimaeribacter arupi TaxID=2060066 RepID=UPI000C7E8467|nr:type II toxin-antitoxin system RelB/DinJ family antitoxin [Chimaeribacter arupi]MDV5141675.1 type II toxin-antitoxin system RelB/DinJ family antitoxin [Chimaeribacter arupi]PLR31057.1 type II toxin-antitoxin system antitoxin, RelB/DinJ family [Chimaeribacter arupi]PLR52001.1 type II toxin-antitoxin system antitoxin, RelB/DinJ family [Chimaeribacter arupi]
MAANAIVCARIDKALKDEAEQVLSEMGLTIPQFLRMALTKVAHERAMPFDIYVPNEKTKATIEKSLRGIDVHKAENAEDLFKQLGLK